MELPLFEVPFLAEVDLPGTIPALSIWFSLSTSSRVDALATASRMALASSADGPPLKEKKKWLPENTEIPKLIKCLQQLKSAMC